MIKKADCADKLASIAEQMAMVVDRTLRARLSGEYLELLQEFHTPGPKRRDFNARVYCLLKKVIAGRKQYKLMPGLGTISERFYAAYGNAVKSIGRLQKLADRQADARTRDAWTGFLKDTGFTLQRLYSQAEFSSANVNLSRLDALANQVNNLLASQLLPAEVEWRKRLHQPKVRYEVTQGRSGALAKEVYPSKFNPGFSTPAATLAQRKRPYYRKARIGPTGHGPRLSGLWEDFKSVVTGAWEGAKEHVQGSVDDVKRLFDGATLRARAIRQVQEEQNASIEAMRAHDAQRAAALSSTLEDQRTRLESGIAQLDGIAAEMKTWSYDSLDTPLQMLKENLGLGQTLPNSDVLVTDRTAPATWLLFADRIRAADSNLATLQRESAELSDQINAWSPVKVAAVATGASLGAGALVAAGIGAYLLLRK